MTVIVALSLIGIFLWATWSSARVPYLLAGALLMALFLWWK